MFKCAAGQVDNPFMGVKSPARWLCSHPYRLVALGLGAMGVVALVAGFRGGAPPAQGAPGPTNPPKSLRIVVYPDKITFNDRLVPIRELDRAVDHLYRQKFPIDGPVTVRAKITKEQWHRVEAVHDALVRKGYRNIKLVDPQKGSISGWRGTHELKYDRP